MKQLYEIEGLFPNPYNEGFAANLATLAVSGNNYFTGWSVASPQFASSHFNATTGVYTVPVTGLYAVQATINYIADAPITISLGSSINPAFEVKKTAPSTSTLVSGYLPLMNISVTLLTLRAILGGGSVTLIDVIELTAGDTIQLYYDADGMTLGLTIQNVEWAMFRI